MSESSPATVRQSDPTDRSGGVTGSSTTGLADVVIAAAPCATDESSTGATAVDLSPADRFMRRVLFIREPDPTIGDDQVNKLFETSILISAIRCTLAYVVFPIFAPALYAASSLGPLIGLTVGLIAMVFNVAGMRRFWKSNHRMRWAMTGVYAAVMILVGILVVLDIGHLVS